MDSRLILLTRELCEETVKEVGSQAKASICLGVSPYILRSRLGIMRKKPKKKGPKKKGPNEWGYDPADQNNRPYSEKELSYWINNARPGRSITLSKVIFDQLPFGISRIIFNAVFISKIKLNETGEKVKIIILH